MCTDASAVTDNSSEDTGGEVLLEDAEVIASTGAELLQDAVGAGTAELILRGAEAIARDEEAELPVESSGAVAFKLLLDRAGASEVDP
ncbi:hypothetical protein PC119_g17652 [Phytophthora cactorum]|nr:hypothetical protein PC114_g3199 [Phytophthora cactorum]KAG2997514.1 hypothetical protein PC119_g17652 [Phytophthora cactorum]